MAQTGRKAGITHFSQWLHVSRNVVNGCLISGTVPDYENMMRMAAKLGNEFYAICGRELPDPRLRAITAGWQYIDDETKTRMARIAEEKSIYRIEKEETDETIEGNH